MITIISYHPKRVEQFLTSLGHIEAGGCTEIRILPKNPYLVINGKREYVGNTVAGYYDDYAKAARDIAPFDGHASIYATLNPCDRKLMRRAYNKLAFKVKATASDKDILSVLWLPFDVDPVRPADTPSSDEELQLALECRDRIIEEIFEPHNVPVIPAMSGNGGHGLIPLIGYPNTHETQARLKRLLDYLAETYSDAVVSVDRTVGNPARIWKVYGTLACKGDNTPSAPYRRAFIELPETIEPFDLLAVIDEIIPPNWRPADEQTSSTFSGTRRASSGDDYPLLDVERYLTHYRYEFKLKTKGGRKIHELDRCPFNPDHNGGEVCITQDADGKLGFKCFHNSCADKKWQDARDAIGDPTPFYVNQGYGQKKTSPNGNGKANQSKPKGKGQSLEAVLSEISQLDNPTPESIQSRLWDFVHDAVFWDLVSFGRFCETLHTQFDIKKVWIKDWKNVVLSEKRKRGVKYANAKYQSELPVIVVTNRHMRDVTADTMCAIQKANTDHSFLFVRSGMLTRIKTDEKGHATTQPLTVSAARGLIERVASFMREVDVEGEPLQIPVNPPVDIASDLLSLPSYPDILPLVSVVTFPIVAPDGTIHTQGGYEPKTRCYYHKDEGLSIGNTTPTSENLEKAKKLIWEEVLRDFPFVDPASRANTIAEMLTPLVRPMIQGATPLFAHDASTPGTGKTLLATVCTIPYSLSGASIMTAGRDDDEWRKRITAKLMTGTSHILIDNVKGKLTSGDLAAALTVKGDWEDRILGQSQMVRLPVRCTWIVTGNNLELDGEIARRSVWIRLDAKMERPWKRTEFRHENLEGWVTKHRSEILTALLTFVRKWIADGKPKSDVTLGGYEEWSHIVGGILKAVGIDGFLENADELYDQLDTEREAWVNFFSVWAETFGAYDPASKSWGAWSNNGEWKSRAKDSVIESVGIKELFPLASTYDNSNESNGECWGLLDGHLGKGNERARRNYLGRLLANKYKARVFGEYRLEVLEKTVNRAKQFRLVNIMSVDKDESTAESNDFDSLSQEASNGAVFTRQEEEENESNESKTTLSQDVDKIPTQQAYSIYDSNPSEYGAGFDSFDSFDLPNSIQETSRDAGSGKDESNVGRFTQFLNQWYAQRGENSVSPGELIPIAQWVGFDLTVDNRSPYENINRLLVFLRDHPVNGWRVVQNPSGTWCLAGDDEPDSPIDDDTSGNGTNYHSEILWLSKNSVPADVCDRLQTMWDHQERVDGLSARDYCVKIRNAMKHPGWLTEYYTAILDGGGGHGIGERNSG